MSKKTFTLIILIILIVLGGGYYWFFVRVPSLSVNTNSTNNQNSGNGIFAPFGQPNQSNSVATTSNNSSIIATSTISTVPVVPVLRELSTMPVGGMMSSTTASTTIVRWIDRGTGHIYQAYADNTAIDEISNTTIPMIYQSYWNTAANSFIFSSLSDNSNTVNDFYTTLIPSGAAPVASTSASTSSAQLTQYSLAGSPLSGETLALAVSPTLGKSNNQVLTLLDDGNGGSAGYISNFDGSKKTQIFDTPLQQINIQWPAATTVAVTTKATASGTGFLYFVNPKTGNFNKIIGGIYGLSTLTNSDASEVLYSHTNTAGTGITTSIYNVTTGQSSDLPFNTLAEKCVWSTLQKTDLYCAIPSNIPSGTYPDSWYQGTVSFSDSLWEIDTITGDVHELIDLTKTAGQPVDAENLQLSPDESFIYFINKTDLSLWSFNLNAI